MLGSKAQGGSERMFGVKVRVEFSAAHHIRGYDGDCARPHGHNFKVEVEALTPALNPIGIALDFKDLKKLIHQIVDRFDHQDLNTIPPFTDVNPTAETLSQHFYEELERGIRSHPATQNLLLKSVTVWENDRSAASFGYLS
ncbi:MAG: 6-carboxytetrahydropterin synthase QueD [Bdellovibrionota bacterium]